MQKRKKQKGREGIKNLLIKSTAKNNDGRAASQKMVFEEGEIEERQ